MSTTFQPTASLIVVSARIWGPAGVWPVKLALDTGATFTTIRTAVLMAMGYDPALSPSRVQMTTGSGIEYVPRIVLDRIEALGQSRRGLAVVAHTLPPTASVDGLLRLDFLRNRRLNIDFRAGRITLC